MKYKTNLALLALALAAGVSTAFAQSKLLEDDFADPNLSGWTTGGFRGTLTQVNQQLVLSENFFGPAQTNNPNATHLPAIRAFPNSGPFPDQQTLEIRADLVSTSQNDLGANLALNWAAPALGSGYMLNKDEDEISLLKFYNGATSYAYFFDTNQPVKNQNVTLVLAVTRDGSNVRITSRVLDIDNANAVLFDRTVTDTPQADPVLPNRAMGGFVSMADPPGIPWPAVQAPAYVELTMTWIDPQHAPQHPAQVIFDNLEVWQYESPPLTIQNAVVLSWPVPQGQGPFVVESAANLDSPWTPVPEPWLRNLNGECQVSVLAPDNLKFFRLRFSP